MAKEKPLAVLEIDCPKCDGTGSVPGAVGSTMRTMRENSNMSLSRMALRLGCHKSTLSQMENDLLPWTKEWIDRYVKACKK